LLKRFTNNLTILYDGDAAGIKASFRGIDMILEQEMNVKVVLFPDGEDPDSFSHKLNKSEFKEYIENNEQDFIKFKTSLLLEDAQGDPIKRSRLVSEIVSSIAVIPDAITRGIYIKECSNLLKVTEDALYSETNKRIFKKRETERKTQFNKAQQEIKQSQTTAIPGFVEEVFAEVNEQELISLLLNFGNHELYSIQDEATFTSQIVTVADYITTEILNDDLEFKNLVYKQIFEDYINALRNGEQLDEKHFINHQDVNIQKIAANLLSQNYKTSAIWEKGGKKPETTESKLKEVVQKAVSAYKLKIVQKAIKDNQEKTKEAGTDMEKIKELFRQKEILLTLKKDLSEQTGHRIIL
ncbi:MAG: hypothetical protein L3J74_06545, partial [Bacteroidales bacterium]|nr:hypothetical protein [Bacteroidales bacterium]